MAGRKLIIKGGQLISSTPLPLKAARAAVIASKPRTVPLKALRAALGRPRAPTIPTVPMASQSVKKRTDLNATLDIDEQGRTNKTVIITQPVEVLFQNISAIIADKIRTSPYVVGCMAWLTDPAILSALASCRGVSFVVTNDTVLNSVSVRQRYAALQPLDASRAAVRCVGVRTGASRSLMHHKFLVGLDAARVPAWVAVGSYNASSQAVNNIESVVFLPCPAIARVYYDEFCVIEKSSKTLKPLRKA